MLELRESAREMFLHGYWGYINHAFPSDELQSVSCKGMETWGGYSLTLVDSLDMLVLVGMEEEFHKRVRWITDNLSFDRDVNVSVFETNIRVLGGLLSAHMFYEDGVVDDSNYAGGLLTLAEDLGKRMLPAFKTETGIPYGTVNLRYGVPEDETPVTSTAGGGTFLLEMGLLTRLTGDTSYRDAAIEATRSIHDKRSELGLVGNHINTSTGRWTHKEAGIGCGIDSYYEYMWKYFVLFGDYEMLRLFRESEKSIQAHLFKDPWYIDVHMQTGAVAWPLYNSLQGFWPGVQAQTGNVHQAKRTSRAMHGIWRRFGAVPEGFNLLHGKVQAGQEAYPLRPELLEGIYHLYQSTKDPSLLRMGRDFMYSLNSRTRTECGFASLSNVEKIDLSDRMESFFLSETIKYLFLLFDEDNFINTGYVFTTEGHPFPVREVVGTRYPDALAEPELLAERLADLEASDEDSVYQVVWKKPKFQCPKHSYWDAKARCEIEFKA